MRIFLLTGEPSGDMHGARLAEALRTQDPTVEILGVGGTRMREAGVRLIAESEHWGAIGIPEAIRKVPFLLWQMRTLARTLRADPPDVLVPIDFGAFNVRLIRQVRGAGNMRIVYYIPPGCWSRHRRPGMLPFLVDAIATPFPWSAENLRAAGAPAQIAWTGHPLLDYCRVTISRDEARALLDLDPSRPVVAIIPGSRRQELRYVMPAFLEAVGRLTPAPQCLITVAPSLGEAAVRRMLPPGLDVRLLRGIDHNLVQAADAALATSGTATLELAILGLPMVVAYRGSFGTWVQYQILLKTRAHEIKHISLPNILADAAVVPELLQEAASPQGLADALTPLLTATPARQRQLDAFAGIRESLGDGHAVQRAAELVLSVGHAAPSLAPQLQR